MAVVAAEVSGQVLARQRLAEANAQLTRTNAELDNFIYTASHDLKATILNIEGLVLALRDQLPAKVRTTGPVVHLLDLMQGSVGRFQTTIAQLTDIMKLQQAHAQPPESVPLAALIENIRLDMVTAWEAAGVELTIDVEACPTVSFAPQNLRSIVYNLLNNAVKYCAPDRAPCVLLRCHSTRVAVVLTVQDNGLGLDEGQQAKLYGLFQRQHTHVEGSGIGLYMVKKIVDNAGGTIAVVSQPGVGTTFTITLPAPGHHEDSSIA